MPNDFHSPCRMIFYDIKNINNSSFVPKRKKVKLTTGHSAISKLAINFAINITNRLISQHTATDTRDFCIHFMLSVASIKQ